MPDAYAIMTIIGGRRYYWSGRTKHGAGQWGVFRDATHYTPKDRKTHKLPHGGQWISLLHGIGKDNFYPADSELKHAKSVVRPVPK